MYPRRTEGEGIASEALGVLMKLLLEKASADSDK